MHPGTSFTTFMIVAALGGLGGGNFASSMTNINAFFPEGRKGWALGLNAGGGNLGVAAVQLLGLLVIATAGTGYPRLVLAIYIPLIVLAALCAALFMDNLSSVRNDTGALREAARDPQTWVMSFLYIGTFGSFIGYSFAFGLVLQNQFGRTPLQAAAVIFIGPLIGSLIRPVGGWLADRYGGARVTSGTSSRWRWPPAWYHGARTRSRCRCSWSASCAVHPLRHRQRLHLQDDPVDLRGKAPGGDRRG